MTTYTTLVNVDADIAKKLAFFISSRLLEENSTKFYEDCQKLIDEKKSAELVNKLLEQSEFILALEKDSEVESCFQSLFSILYSLGDASNESPAIIRSIISKLTSNKENEPKRRLGALVVLFNLTYSAESRLEVLNAVCSYAVDTQLISSISHLHTRIDDWMTTWSLTLSQKRALLLTFTRLLEQVGLQKQSLTISTQYFKTFQQEVTIDAQVEELMIKAVVNAVNSPPEAYSDRSALLEAFNGFKFTSSWSVLLTLLKIIVEGSLDDFTRFYAKNSAVFTQYKLNKDDLEYKMKLLSLATLASQLTTPERVLSFSEISQSLKIPLEEVEIWVIDAIGNHLLDASIDQLSGRVTVSRYAHRSFTAAHWKMIQAKLNELRTTLSYVQEQIQLTA